MTYDDVQTWLDRYVAAWRSSDPELIGDLFTEDATYRYYAYADAERGREAIVAGWLDDPDDPESWEASYEPWAIDGDRAVAIGTSRYFPTAEQPERIFWNCFLLTFDADGRCADFVEYYMRQPL